MSKTSIDTYQVLSDLESASQIIQAMQPVIGLSGVEFYTEIGRRLGELAGREKPYTWRYVASVVRLTLTNEPGKDFMRSLYALGSMLDGTPKEIASSEQVVCYAAHGTVENGTLILTSSRRCANPACVIKFIPKAWNQRYHSRECNHNHKRG